MNNKLSAKTAVATAVVANNKFAITPGLGAAFKAATIPATAKAKVISSINKQGADAMRNSAVSRMASSAFNPISAAIQAGNSITSSHSSEWLFF